MKLQYGVIWKSKPVLEKVYLNTTNGKLRRRCKHNVMQMQPFFEDIIKWINDDRDEHGWANEELSIEERNKLMEEADRRFIDFLLSTDETVEYTPYRFSEELMEFADGITGQEENDISWLFDENQPKE